MKTEIPDDPTTPRNPYNSKVVALLAEIRRVGGGILPNARPVYVPVLPEANALPRNCFPNVLAKKETDGGELVVGWILRHEPTVMSAEFHGVWQPPSGGPVDITPKTAETPWGVVNEQPPRILFIPAPGMKFEGKQVNSILLNVSGNPLADDFIACKRAMFKIANRGERAYQHQHGDIVLEGREAAIHEGLEQACVRLSWMVQHRMAMNSPCLCRSGKGFDDCCGKVIREALESAREFE